MQRELRALIVAVPVLLCAASYGQMLVFGFSYRKLLVPTAVTQLPAYRSCPSQTQVTFTAYPKLKHREGGLSAAGLDFPSVSPVDSQQFSDCLARARIAASRSD